MITKKLINDLRWVAEEKDRELTITTKEAKMLLDVLWDYAWETTKERRDGPGGYIPTSNC